MSLIAREVIPMRIEDEMRISCLKSEVRDARGDD